jgi:hypothetical protein
MNMATLSLNISLSHCDRQFSIIGVSSVGRYLLSCCVERDISGEGRENEAEMREEGDGDLKSLNCWLAPELEQQATPSSSQ